VVIGFCWYAYFTGILDPEHVGDIAPLVPGTDRALDNIRKMAAGFTAAGKQVHILLSQPVDPGFPPRQMIRRTLTSGFELDIRPPSRAQVDRAVEPFVSKLVQIAQQTGAKVIDQMDSLCDSQQCPAVTASGEPIYRDSFHMRLPYVLESVAFLDELVLGADMASQPELPAGGPST
jgi:SGNH domain-containing protein